MEASIYRLRLQDILAVCVLALLALGVIMVQSASASVTADARWVWSPLAIKHMTFVAASIVTFFVVGRIGYNRLARQGTPWLRSPVLWAFVISGAGCALVLVPHV